MSATPPFLAVVLSPLDYNNEGTLSLDLPSLIISFRVPTAQGKQGKWLKKIPVRENTGNLEILPKDRENTGNFVCSSCKFPDAKGKGYCNICCENFHFFPRSWRGLQSQFCVCNSYKLWKLAQGKFVVGQGKHREFENTI